MCHVLIIEDEFLIALDIQQILESQGASSFAFAGTEVEAVAEARQRRPAFISSDVVLRLGTGPKAVQTIQRELGRVPVIFITGSPELCHPREAVAPVFDKPMNEQAIGAAFKALVSC